VLSDRRFTKITFKIDVLTLLTFLKNFESWHRFFELSLLKFAF